MARPKSLGQYAPLSASYYRDDAILESGERAELLFVRGLAYCSESASDGFISDRQLIAVVGIGMRDVVKRALTLVSVGLWEKVDGGYVVRSWLRWNKSAEEIGRHLKKDRERKAAGKPAGIHADSTRNPDGLQTDSSYQSTTQQSTSLHDTTQHGSARTEPGAADTSTASPQAARLDEKRRVADAFERFWALYPRKVAKADAEKVWAKALKIATLDVILAGVERYADSVRHKEAKHIAHAATWLNGRRWDDEPERKPEPETPAASPRDVGYGTAMSLADEYRAAEAQDRLAIEGGAA